MFAPVISRSLRHAALALALCAAGAAQASTLHVELDTGFLSGTTGYLDLLFSRSNNAVAASAFISGLSGVDASAPVLSGDAQQQGGGYLLGNSTDFNDLFQALHFGGKVSFNVSFSGLADPASAPSTLSVGLYGDDQLTQLGHVDDTGSILHLNWLPDANGTGTVTSQVIDAAAVTAVPEPSSWLMLGAGLGLLGLVRRRRLSHN